MPTSQANVIDDTLRAYERDGYVIHPSLFSDDKLTALEQTLSHRLGLDPEQDLIEGLRQTEQNNKSQFYQLCTQEIWFTVAALGLMTDVKLIEQVAKYSGSEPGQLSPVGHGLFWNDPACPRLHYKWHQEAAYYPGLTNVVSVWFPLVYDLVEACGPMLVAKGSHGEYIDCSSEAQQGGVTQMEISEQVAQKFDIVPCAMNRGDAIIFHQNIIHKTGINSTQRPRLSGIIRFANLNSEARKTPYWTINPDF
ncbi:MAG: hypothetical protein COA42_01940 [Alteromonadaceae bacterium]|nr:MAG: hypothetical protein COA42_01940 [Alteromonadaceae bacterium]